jgi:hypothetical protein
MKYYVVAGSNKHGDLVVLDTYRGWFIYGVPDVQSYILGRPFRSHSECKRAARRALRLFPNYHLVPTEVVSGGKHHKAVESEA